MSGLETFEEVNQATMTRLITRATTNFGCFRSRQDEILAELRHRVLARLPQDPDKSEDVDDDYDD